MAESAAACCRRAVPCRRRTHRLALSRAPKWPAKRSPSEPGMSLLFGLPTPILSIPLLQRSSRHLPLWATERTLWGHHALADGATSRAPGPRASVRFDLRMCLGEGPGRETLQSASFVPERVGRATSWMKEATAFRSADFFFTV